MPTEPLRKHGLGAILDQPVRSPWLVMPTLKSPSVTRITRLKPADEVFRCLLVGEWISAQPLVVHRPGCDRLEITAALSARRRQHHPLVPA